MNKNTVKVNSPVNGKCIDLKNVPDPIFNQKMMGEGVAFEYNEDILVSPIDGRVAVIAPTKHAIGIKGNGVDVLLHIGVDTVNLDGEGFENLVEMNQKVKVGTPLIKIDKNFMGERQIDLITPMIITNSADLNIELVGLNKEVTRGTSVIECTAKEEIAEEKTMKYEKLCKDIIKNVGGKDNIISVTHCVTRLRFKV